MKNHYLNVEEAQVSVILGKNGYIWIYYNPAAAETDKEADMIESLMRGEHHELNLKEAVAIPKEVKIGMARVRNVIVILDRLNLPIYDYSINKALELTKDLKSAFDILTDKSVAEGIEKEIISYIFENFTP
mmetsp:Transcript_28558/g.32643  ORF Transcript_28558/g.32643 Transcript_28558/m.32643 type:complete len:131 (+) Transcript_28558:489-881(+)